MKRAIYFFLFLGLLFIVSCNRTPKYKNPNLPIEERINDLMNRLTFEEKILLIGGDSSGFSTLGVPRLQVPPLRMSDGPLGIRRDGSKATSFPSGVLMASSWDTTLIYREAEAIGKECRAYHIDVLLGPCINIHRFPYGGRNFESYSEDPFLVSRMCVGYVKGLESQKIIPTIKHFACNNQEWERNNIDVIISERALQEIYLPGFKAGVIDGNAMGVMSAYNIVNGSHCSESRHLLTDLLKNEWGFKGFVVSDWVSVYSTDKAVLNGLDIEMPRSHYFSKDSINNAIKKNLIDAKDIDDKVRRVLRVRFWAGLFDNPAQGDTNVLQSSEHKNLAREAAEEGIILLKNNGILPLQKDKIKKIAVIGPAAKELSSTGGGSAYITPVYKVSIYDGIKSIMGDKVDVLFAEGDPFPTVHVNPIPSEFLYPPVNMEGKGFYAEYYNNIDFKGEPVLKRFEKEINFDWGQGSPDKLIHYDNFGVILKGRIIPKETGKYELQIGSDDGSRLYVNNKLVVDNWGEHGRLTKSGYYNMKAGVSYTIKIEYYDAGQDANLVFGWKKMQGNLPDEIVEAIKIAKQADIVVLCVGDNSDIESEGHDREMAFNMAYKQELLIKNILKVNKNTVIVLHTGVPVNVSGWLNDTKALVQAAFPGQEGGNAIARILFGEINPSGKLTYSFISGATQSPVFDHYQNPDLKAPYGEGIYVGYRFLNKTNLKPVFPFGFGLSYTTFNYSNLQLNKKENDEVEVNLDVQNTGKMAGDEIVQLYVHDVQSTIDRPVKELKGFSRVSLQPGEKKTVSIKLKKDAFTYFDESKNKWVLESGDFDILVGASSEDIRLKGTLKIE